MKCELIKHTSERRGRKRGKMSGRRVLTRTRVLEGEGNLWYLFEYLKGENIVVNITSMLSFKVTYFSSSGKAAKGWDSFGISACLWGSNPPDTFVQFSHKHDGFIPPPPAPQFLTSQLAMITTRNALHSHQNASLHCLFFHQYLTLQNK